MLLPRTCILLLLVGLANCEKHVEEDASAVFLEAAKSFFANKDSMNGLQGLASAFVQPDTGKQGNDMFGGKTNVDGIGQIISGIGALFEGNENRQGMDYSIIGSVLDSMVNTNKDSQNRVARDVEKQEESSLDFEGLLNIGSMLFGQNSGNSDFMMGLLPMLLQNLGNGANEVDGHPRKPHDHSGHSWYMPPVLEHLHVMWDHFSNSELGQTLWKNSGLAQFVGQMSDPNGRLQYEKMLDSFENPSLRRRWIRALTNYVGEWISHVSDPQIQQRYLNTAQFVGNSFLKSQGFPKSAMFDAMRPVESLSRLVDAVAKRHVGMQVDSSQYIRPAVAYIQELIALASEKGFIMSRVNAREISNRLSDVINHDIVDPMLKSYRAYKWSIKRPQCASQILCTINEMNEQDKEQSPLRSGILKATSYPAAWAVSNKLGTSFWTLYGAITEHSRCIQKYPAACTEFHEEEIRVTTESTHSEL
ncbi:PREDICTED: uncharacterized protein LOC107193098 [Dufourea novaeangliae]|uniref:Uncharacterized protein n=1 Tax=Dufourea novaeangliae TaxID=178035 RepID=A0A154PST5_DUFNO|nr:PREDICTED: uncharacterized protein LOC107193098 [Dufourea novaeangliae]KZC14971.1 hypothetical protein WN55_07819 [Dufourea novaeangliae]